MCVTSVSSSFEFNPISILNLGWDRLKFQKEKGENENSHLTIFVKTVP